MDLIFKGPSDSRLLALTIDDFPSSGTGEIGTGSMALLDLLGELQIPATFFCIGKNVSDYPGLVARAVKEGHELGNHMARDQWSVLLNKEQFFDQAQYTSIEIMKDLKQFRVPPVPLKWIRPSGGWPTPRMLDWAETLGYRTVLGSIWPFDGLSLPLPDKGRIALQQEFIERFVHPGGIIVMHDTDKFNPLTRETLKMVVPQLKAEGYTFVRLSELLG
ncbi:MAG: polysaccharide deacetylase family protein [Cyanobacteriota bacterium]